MKSNFQMFLDSFFGEDHPDRQGLTIDTNGNIIYPTNFDQTAELPNTRAFLDSGWRMWQAAQEQALQRQWINIDHCLPLVGETVLVCWDDDHDIEPEKDFVDVCVDTGNKYWSNFNDSPPTHWMHLPQLPIPLNTTANQDTLELNNA